MFTGIYNAFNSFNNGESIDTSALGRKLDFNGKCIRFMMIKRGPITDKVFTAAHKVLEGLAYLIPMGSIAAGGGYLIRRSFSPHLTFSSGLFGVISLITTLVAMILTHEYINQRITHPRKMEERDQALVDAVNSRDKDAFKKLPRITEKQLYDWASMGSQFYTGYTNVPLEYLRAPLAVGVDDGNRPTFCACVEQNGCKTAITLFSRYTDSLDNWVVTGPVMHNILQKGQCATLLKQLVEGTHPEYKLVTPLAQ